MTMRGCKREEEVRRALRDGGLDTENHAGLRQHAATCADCSQAVKLAALFREDAAQLSRVATLPPVARILNEAASRRQKAALERAATIFQALRVVGVAYGVAVGIWLLHLLSRPGIFPSSSASVPSVSASFVAALPRLDTALLGNMTGNYVAGGLLALAAFIVSGLWMTLRDERVAG